MPVEQQSWLSRSSTGRRYKGQSGHASSGGTHLGSGRYHVLGEVDNETAWASKDQLKPEGSIKSSNTVDLSTAVEAEVMGQARSSPLTSEENLRKTAGQQRGTAPVTTVPVLLTLKYHERTALRKQLARTQNQLAAALPMGARSTTIPANLADLENQIGVRSVVTPATGNCLAMSIAQAVADANLEAPDHTLELVTASIKRGIKYTGLLALEGHSPTTIGFIF